MAKRDEPNVSLKCQNKREKCKGVNKSRQLECIHGGRNRLRSV